MKRKFHFSNGNIVKKVGLFESFLAMELTPEWNQLELNLQHLTNKLYGTKFQECTRIHIHPNCRLRRIYFSDKHYDECELPDLFKLFRSEKSPDSLLQDTSRDD
ncbi:cilia- and flagella-associated protein 20-like isoform X2 [Cimex lectularius]|nr:cilia- and flagella-associated protein 20-like isoform X2 [Cimex lectularius]XP_024086411.1 cilia- and flagella-associated protein 20-like isoform X2 [Cimex lectularius]XP_024086412.1 cilia- and flagella-associated protein 20-like isoform X2 [Cimex lectularius]